MKTANTIFQTGIMECEHGPLFGGDVLEYEGHRYLIGTEHKAMIDNKITDPDDYLLTLAAIAKELNTAGMTSADVHLATGLPLTWVARQKESYRQYLLQNPHVDFRFNETDYHVNIVGCSVFPQGYAAIVPLLRESDFFSGMTMLADIGRGTRRSGEA